MPTGLEVLGLPFDVGWIGLSTVPPIHPWTHHSACCETVGMWHGEEPLLESGVGVSRARIRGGALHCLDLGPVHHPHRPAAQGCSSESIMIASPLDAQATRHKMRHAGLHAAPPCQPAATRAHQETFLTALPQFWILTSAARVRQPVSSSYFCVAAATSPRDISRLIHDPQGGRGHKLCL